MVSFTESKCGYLWPHALHCSPNVTHTHKKKGYDYHIHWPPYTLLLINGKNYKANWDTMHFNSECDFLRPHFVGQIQIHQLLVFLSFSFLFQYRNSFTCFILWYSLYNCTAFHLHAPPLIYIYILFMCEWKTTKTSNVTFPKLAVWLLMGVEGNWW